jgi:Tol biopolymer transport system component
VSDVYEGDVVVGRELRVLDTRDGATDVLLDGPPNYMLPFVWQDAGHLVAGQNEGGPAHFLRVGLDGSQADFATADAPADYFYPSPDGSVVAFTQDGSEGWRLYTLDLASAALTDYGNMGSDPVGTQTPEEFAEVKGPMYISWSPDGTRLAFGGGVEPPYTMRTVDLTTGNVALSRFAEGYPGEIKWSADGTVLAVSTYDVDRTRHEVYVVDPETGEGRHLMDGCLLVWSPDGRFLAAHAERLPGIAIVDVASGAHGHLTHDRADIPVAWE